MANTHGSARTRVGLLGLVSLVGLAVASCSSTPTVYDQQSDPPETTGTVSAAVTGAVGNWSGFTDGQCVTGVFHFFEARYGASFTGLCAQGANVGNCENCGACMLWNGPRVEPNAGVWNRYAWGSVMPQLYDMVVYGAAGGAFGYGHVAAVDHMNGSNPSAYGSMYVMDTNWYGNEKMATAVHTVPRVPLGIYRLKSLTNIDVAPKGYMDLASCTAVAGWAQDTSVATAAINTDVYFNGAAGNASAVAIRLSADGARSDLCTPLGSCNHAWSMPTPRGAKDGKDHQVYAYGIDSAGGANTLLADSPKTINCPTPALDPTTVKRAIPSMTIVNDWKMSTFFDMATYTDAQLKVIAEGPAFDQPPTLEQAKGDPAVYIVAGTERRHVTSPASFSAWRFDAAKIKIVTAAEIAALTPGLDWPATPLLVKGDGATVFLLDNTAASPSNPSGSTGSASTTPTAQGTDPSAGDTASASDGSGSSGGCTVTRDSSRSGGMMWLVGALVGLALVRRREHGLASSTGPAACSKSLQGNSKKHR